MTGDTYTVFYNTFKAPGYSAVDTKWHTWPEAKAARNDKFYDDRYVKSCWIIVTNDVYDLLPKKYGHTMTRQFVESNANVAAYRERKMA